MKKFSMPKCHDYNVKETQGSSIESALDTFSSSFPQEENITISVRAKDEKGDWYFTVMVMPLSNLDSGDEIIINDSKKLIAE